jgi:hypothetical protein
MKEQDHGFKSVVMLQNCMGFIKDEPDSGSEACVTTLDDGNEEGNIKVEVSDIKLEESIDIKEENPEAIIPPVKCEPEVSVWGLCVRQQQVMFHRPFTETKRELLKLHFNCLYVCGATQKLG